MATDISNSIALPIEQKDRIELWFDHLKGEITSVLAREAGLQEAFRSLQSELSVYKRAYADVDNERQQLVKLKEDAEKQRNDLEVQLKGNRVVALLDGDGTIFSSDLIAQGQAGGHKAAQRLTDSILQYMNTNFGLNQYQLWVYIFLNKRGLTEAFGRYGLLNLKLKLEEFMLGFNQAAERFMMVDVGTTKEAADAKIKAYLEDEIRLPQTYKVLFGGCHDNGYVTNLRSQITAGFKQKIVLIQSYAEIAAGIAELDLPLMSCPDLFMPRKLGPHSCTSSVSTTTRARSSSVSAIVPPHSSEQAQPVPERRETVTVASAVIPFAKLERRDSVVSLPGYIPQFKPERRDSIASTSSVIGFDVLEAAASNSPQPVDVAVVPAPASPTPVPVITSIAPTTTSPAPVTVTASPAPVAASLVPATTYPAPVTTLPASASVTPGSFTTSSPPVSSSPTPLISSLGDYTPKRPAGPPPTYSSAVLSSRRSPTPELDSCGSSDVSDDHPSPHLSAARHVNPNIPLSKHKPPPCTLFYLANCKYGADCKYAHNYILEAEHFEEIKVNAKKAPCPSLNKGEPCIWGEACCYGHVCPSLSKCHYLKQGRCKFTGADMHREPKVIV